MSLLWEWTVLKPKERASIDALRDLLPNTIEAKVHLELLGRWLAEERMAKRRAMRARNTNAIRVARRKR